MEWISGFSEITKLFRAHTFEMTCRPIYLINCLRCGCVHRSFTLFHVLLMQDYETKHIC